MARRVTKEVGFTSEDIGLDCDNCNIITNIEAQDHNIAMAVHKTKSQEDMGAGDQGLMFGYATDEWDTETLHPLSHILSSSICEEMAKARKNKTIEWLRPDCKSQVIVEYRKESNGKLTPISVFNVLISTQHDPTVELATLRSTIENDIVRKVIPEDLITDETKIIINPSEKFDVGGPAADAGLTGRKIIVDTYGGWCPHGGGAFSGKDPSKVDRSAAYYARYVAKSLVAAKLCHRALVQVSYAIGLADPLSIHVEDYGSSLKGYKESDYLKIIKKNFNFRPGMIIEELDLKRPIYQKTAAFGHFGRTDPDFTWEQPKELDLEI